MQSVAVPFAYDYFARHPVLGTMVVHGVVRTEAEGLVIEYQERRRLISGETPSDEPIRTLVIPWDGLQSVTVREPWFRKPRIVLRTRSLRPLEGFPNARGSKATLFVARADRELVRELAAATDAALAEHRLRALDAPHSPPALDAPESPRSLDAPRSSRPGR